MIDKRKWLSLSMTEAMLEKRTPGEDAWLDEVAQITMLYHDSFRDKMRVFLRAYRANLLSQRGEPWIFAIEEENKDGIWSWRDGENCVFGDLASAQYEVDLLNDKCPEGEKHARVVPLYRAGKLDLQTPRRKRDEVSEPQGKHVCCWERENPHRCILCCQCGKKFDGRGL